MLDVELIDIYILFFGSNKAFERFQYIFNIFINQALLCEE